MSKRSHSRNSSEIKFDLNLISMEIESSSTSLSIIASTHPEQSPHQLKPPDNLQSAPTPRLIPLTTTRSSTFSLKPHDDDIIIEALLTEEDAKSLPPEESSLEDTRYTNLKHYIPKEPYSSSPFNHNSRKITTSAIGDGSSDNIIADSQKLFFIVVEDNFLDGSIEVE